MNLFEATDPEHFAYEPLVIKRVSKETEEASERLYDHVEQLDKKSSLPEWLELCRRFPCLRPVFSLSESLTEQGK